ncbi:unnamed protein product [Bursaphelenchus xylophilus]|uniref:(pine wood nematode) hypothetical protein n=1 Tax=Bursaphelenchus xylophilus TaxID=6326 RepID=A0A1I7SDR8_BURXY|nr:unnamed protein product [Bursaphelenchus xylophilus]CAG9084375.1 unnamed protein product [Bursaphelenchus xylophilus]
MPFCLPGIQKTSSVQAPLEWSDSNLLICGVENTIVVVDVKDLTIIQTLTRNKNTVCQLSCQPAVESQGNHIFCVSSDSTGQISIWDIIHGKILHQFSSAVVSYLKWLAIEDEEGNFPYVLSLSSKSTVDLYDALNGFSLWSFKSSNNIAAMAIDPFKYSEVAFFSGNNCLMFTHDFGIEHPFQFDPIVTQLKLNESQATIRQLEYHKALPNRLYVLISDRILIVHAETKVVIYCTQFDSIGSVGKILPCSMRDAFYYVRSNGVVSFNIGNIYNVEDGAKSVLRYENVAGSESHRMSTKLGVRGSALCPHTESKVAVLLSNGRFVIHKLWNRSEESSLVDRIKLREDLTQEPFTSLRFSQYNYLNCLGIGMTAVRVRPMDPHKNLSDELDVGLLAAVASSTGTVYLVDVLSCKIVREFQIHSCQIRALEWGGSDLIITAGYSTSLSSSTVRNDLFITNIRTGQKKRLRPEAEESPIELLRVSHYHCYLAVCFRREPLEIWDIRSRRLLRRMSKKCPIIMDMNWFARHTKAQTNQSVMRENLVVMDVDNHLYHVVVKGLHVRDGKEVNTDWSKNSAPLSRVVWKDDYLVFGDTMGFLRIWDLGKKRNREMKDSNAHRGSVLRMVFSSLAGDYTLSVLHQNHVAVWDVESLQLLQSIQINGLTMCDVDMSGVTPVYITSMGSLHYGAHGEHLCASIQEGDLPTALKSFLNPSADDIGFSRHLKLGLNMEQLEFMSMPTYLSFLWPPDVQKRLMELDVGLLMDRVDTIELINYVVERSIVLGKYDWATSLLLDTSNNSNDPGSLANSFKACLLSSDVSREESRCLIKMVATNLIASGKISDGVQLLYLIDQREEACKYLASQGHCDKAFTYLRIDPNADEECLKKCLSKKKILMVTKKITEFLFLASTKEHLKCIQRLKEMKLYTLAERMAIGSPKGPEIFDD